MRRLLAALLAASGLSFAAQAADMPVKAPLSPPPIMYNWTGFYVGGHLGVATGKYDWSFTAPGTTTNHTFTDFAGGGQLGFNYQVAQWVFGIEGSGTFGNLDAESVCPNPAATCRSETDWIAALTGRVGYAWDNVLLYAKGGGAWTHQNYHGRFAATSVFNESGESDRTGWTVGAGVEWAFLKDWSARLEYDYYDFGTDRVDFTSDTTGAFVETADIKSTIHTVMLGLNYRFSGWFK